ncbi:MAG: type II toxin-antitoxin system PemK/MazF family toxin [Opitutaceae bacterium]|jgi:mRNA-degrading endonuclease toxin of MazEF toxin-antitoxin module
MKLRQWDVVKVRINPSDRDEHPAVIISPDDVVAVGRRINVLYGTTRRPGMNVAAHHFVLNGADGLEHPTIVSCAHFYQVDIPAITGHYGHVSSERRRQLARKIVATFRLAL